MHVFYDHKRVYPMARLYPYTVGKAGGCGYVDFKKHPEQIETVLEDFVPFAHWQAVKTFYEFLSWLNGPNCAVESSDCVFRGPGPHKDSHSPHPLTVYGRVIINYRDLRLNGSTRHTQWLCEKLMHTLAGTGTDFPLSEGVVAFSLNPVIQVALSNVVRHEDGTFSFPAGEKATGKALHLAIWFWAYGKDDANTFDNLNSIFRNVWTACEKVSSEISSAVQRGSMDKSSGE